MTEYQRKKESERKKRKYHSDNGKRKQMIYKHRRFLEFTGAIILVRGIL